MISVSENCHGSFDVQRRLFNTPLECGFRLLFILNACQPKGADLQRLISYDYLLVHSGDIDGGPSSIHPPVPFRGSEWIIKRDLVRAGLNLMFSRELILQKLMPNGIVYFGYEMTSAFVDLLKTAYSDALRERSKWLSDNFSSTSDDDLQTFMASNVGQWGAEFDRISSLHHLEL